MYHIALPKKYLYKEGDKKNNAKIILEPCFSGYGITLGNSLRRVLLSSLPGCAVVGVKIEGVSHEFMAIPHIKEDILEILMNLKQLRLKILSEENDIKLTLKANGLKKVTAGDIVKDSAVEIINNDLEIANITDMAGKLNMEIRVRKGIGYETVESRNADNKEIGYIEIDSIFTPILNVGLLIENMRVGKMTNWDRLIIDITTDGTISPDEAFKYANRILIDQFNAVAVISQGEDSENNNLEDNNIENNIDKITEKNDDFLNKKKEEDNEKKIEEESHEEKKGKRGRPKKI
jgi:DNA-directed RNA polymerase subunit alpha